MCVRVCVCVQYTVLFATACGDWGLLNIEESYIKQKYKRLRRRRMSTTSRARRSVEQNKATFKIDTETISQQRKMQHFSTLR